MKRIYSLILKQRLSKGYTQAYMASRLKITQKSYHFLEAGKTNLKVSDLINIVEILEIDFKIVTEVIFHHDCESKCKISALLTEYKKELTRKDLRINQLEKSNQVLENVLSKLLCIHENEKIVSII